MQRQYREYTSAPSRRSRSAAAPFRFPAATIVPPVRCRRTRRHARRSQTASARCAASPPSSAAGTPAPDPRAHTTNGCSRMLISPTGPRTPTHRLSNRRHGDRSDSAAPSALWGEIRRHQGSACSAGCLQIQVPPGFPHVFHAGGRNPRCRSGPGHPAPCCLSRPFTWPAQEHWKTRPPGIGPGCPLPCLLGQRCRAARGNATTTDGSPRTVSVASAAKASGARGWCPSLDAHQRVEPWPPRQPAPPGADIPPMPLRQNRTRRASAVHQFAFHETQAAPGPRRFHPR